MTETQLKRVPNRRARQAALALRRLALVALFGLLLGLVMQSLIIVCRLLGTGALPGAQGLADVAQGVSWAVFVCSGVALGMAIGKGRSALSGLTAALFAPLALGAAKAVHRVMLSLLDAVAQPAVLSLATIGVVRALEYGVLAWLLTLLLERKERRLERYALAGVGVAVPFGGGLVLLTLLAERLPPLALLTLSISEIGTPIGCALVIYVTQLIAANARIWARGAPAAE